MSDGLGTIISSFVFGVLLLFFAWAFAGFITCAALERKCLAAGYPTAKLTPTFDGYCIKRVNQTDVVVPSAEVP